MTEKIKAKMQQDKALQAIDYIENANKEITSLKEQ